jgi:hypothetical protein
MIAAFDFLLVYEHQGATPPKAPLISGFAKILEKSGGPKSGITTYAVFDDGRRFILGGLRSTDARQWIEAHPSESIFLEGFFLRDGAGEFWLNYASTTDETVLVGRENQMRLLQERRVPFGRFFLWSCLIMVLLPYLFAFTTIYTVRSKLE